MGAVQRIDTSVLPRLADTSVGAPGTVAGVTGLLAAEAGLSPTLLDAVTVKV
jgi:hypothetical protein